MEASVLVSGVVYGAGGAICFKQLVVAFDFIAVTFLSLLLDVVSVVVLYTILEFVFGMSLYTGHSKMTFVLELPRCLRRGSTGGRLLGLWARILSVAWMFVSFECYLFCGSVLCVVLTTRSEESYRLWCVSECNVETSIMRRSRPTRAVDP